MGQKRKTPAQLRNAILSHLDDFPRQLLALEAAMQHFGERFELKAFKRAFDGAAGTEAYLEVQAVERAFTRVQKYIAQLAMDGVMLVGLELPRIREGEAARAFEALKQAGVVNPSLCNSLKSTQKVRSAVEHDYVALKAGRVHKAVAAASVSAPEFVTRYKAWIKPYL